MTLAQARQNDADIAKGRILLAEDEPTNMAILAAYLRMAGYEVTEARDGAAAWAVLEKDGGYDLLVTDRVMPNMDGLELAMRVKNDRRLRGIPVIMQTGATSQEEIIEGIRAGVYYYLSKPYEEATLLALVRSAVQEFHQQALFNQKITRQREALSTFAKGEFNVRTPEEAQNVALLLGGIFQRPELAVSGIYELLLNAIEHGNLAIGYEKKNKLLAEGKWNEEIEQRLTLPENKNKKVKVEFTQNNGRLEVVIQDEGLGFDWRPFMEIEPARATQGNGRGIAKANQLSFDMVEYQGKGNVVKATGR